MPLVSIVTPAFNAAAILPETIHSVRAQSFQDWELIIVDDGSMDSTIPVAERAALQDPRIRIIRLAEHGGTANARNKGLDAATGRYTAFLNAGDIWLPNKLERQLAFMQEQDIAVSCTAWRRFYVGSRQTGRLKKAPAHVTFDALLLFNSVHISTVMIDHDKLGAVRFDAAYATHANLALWLDITKAGNDIHCLQVGLMHAAPLQPAQYRTLLYRGWYLWQTYRHVAGLPANQSTLIYAKHLGVAVWKRIF